MPSWSEAEEKLQQSLGNELFPVGNLPSQKEKKKSRFCGLAGWLMPVTPTTCETDGKDHSSRPA
jgi:hypothetical protein